MNLLDLLIIAPVGYFAWKGLYNGFIKELFSLAGLFIAVFITFRYMHEVAALLSPYIQGSDTATIAAGILTFVVILILVQALIFWMEKIVDFINLGGVNKLAGLAFGALKSVILISAFLLLLTAISIPSENNRNSSQLYDHVIFAAPLAFVMIATNYPQAESLVETIEKSLQENTPLRSLSLSNEKNKERPRGLIANSSYQKRNA